MFVGHYGVSFLGKKLAAPVPLWVLFLAVQWLDVVWSPLVLLGIEKVRILPGVTASNPLDLYYMPYTHSLVAAVVWSVAIWFAWWMLAPSRMSKGAPIVALAVFSHWVLDFIAHRPDLPLYDNTAKVGLGLWNVPAAAFLLEAALLLGGMWLFLRDRQERAPMLAFGVIMLPIQALVFFGPPPSSDKAAAVTALVAYVVFAAVIWVLERRQL